MGGRSGLKLGTAGFSASGASLPVVAATVWGGVTVLVAGGLGIMGAVRAGNGWRPSSLLVERTGGTNGCRGPFKVSLAGRGVTVAVLGGSDVPVVAGARAINSAGAISTLGG